MVGPQGKDSQAWPITRTPIAMVRRHLKQKEQKEHKSRDGALGKDAEKVGGPHWSWVGGGDGPECIVVVSMGPVMADPRW